MPARNAEQYITSSVESVLRILKDEDELIVVNDSSSDGTPEILRQFSESNARVRLISNPVRLGVAKSLNRGIELARNPFISRMDADDICLPWRRRLDERQLNAGSDFCFSTAILFGENLRWPIPQFPRRKFNPDLLSELKASNPFVHSTMSGRKAAIVSLGGYQEKSAEDYDLWLRAANAGFRFSREPIPTVLYRVHSNQVTASAEWDSAKGSMRDQLDLDSSDAASKYTVAARLRRKVFGWSRR